MLWVAVIKGRNGDHDGAIPLLQGAFRELSSALKNLDEFLGTQLRFFMVLNPLGNICLSVESADDIDGIIKSNLKTFQPLTAKILPKQLRVLDRARSHIGTC